MRILVALISVAAIGAVAGCDDIEQRMTPAPQLQQEHFAMVRTAMLNDPNVTQVVRTQCLTDAARQNTVKGSRNVKARYCDGVVQDIMSGKRSHRDPAAASATRETPALKAALTGG